MFGSLRVKFWKRKGEPPESRAEPAVEDRSSWDDAIETADDEVDEETPSGMPRLKTDNL